MKRRILLVIVMLLAPAAVRAQSAHVDTTPRLRVLFVGNSYTYFNEYPRLLQNLAIAAGVRNLPEIHNALIGGATLKTHWQDSTSRAAIARGKWDYVVVQTQSREPLAQPDSALKYARLLIEEIRRTGSMPLLVQHWPRKNEPEQGPKLHAAIASIASQLKIPTVPVDRAFARVRATAPDIELYRSDNSHPSLLGSYLAACVLFAYLYDKSPVGLFPYAFKTTFHSLNMHDFDVAAQRIDDNVARILQQAAWEAVRASREQGS